MKGSSGRRVKRATTRELAFASTFDKAAWILAKAPLETEDAFACSAIGAASESAFFCRERSLFTDIFKPRLICRHEPWFECEEYLMDGYPRRRSTKLGKHERLIALGLAAAVCRSGSCSDFVEVE